MGGNGSYCTSVQKFSGCELRGDLLYYDLKISLPIHVKLNNKK